MDLTCPEPYSTPEAAVLTRLWVKLLADYLNCLTYPADLAGLHHSVANSSKGLQLAVYGYNHKLGVLLDKVLQHLVSFEVNEERFTVFTPRLLPLSSFIIYLLAFFTHPALMTCDVSCN
jgi:insulysin